LRRHQTSEAKSEGVPVLCPSARPDMEGSIVFGIVGGTNDQPRLIYFDKPQPVTEEILHLSVPLNPTEVFRFAAPCVEQKCRHFNGSICRLASRTVELVDAVMETVSPCSLRPDCRWWRQEGKEACRRCPLVVTEIRNPTEMQRKWADPSEGVDE
jgi:hypothetical protein